MIILGLHFGHDAGAAIVRDGEIDTCVIRERLTRTKHAITLDASTIFKALNSAGIKASEIDYCAVTSTQGVELIIDDSHQINISLVNVNHTPHIPCTFLEELGGKAPKLNHVLLDNLLGKLNHQGANLTKKIYSKLFPEYKGRNQNNFVSVGWVDQYISYPLWRPRTLEEILHTDYSSVLKQDSVRFGFHLPAEVNLDGHRIPAFFINHHACHAASSYYQSSFTEAAILTHDGGNGLSYDSGMFLYGENNKIYPLTPHHLILGSLYDYVAYFLNLGDLMSAGKLMGLSSYGKPRFYDRNFLGNWNDWITLTNNTHWLDVLDYWLFNCLTMAKEMDYDLSHLANPSNILAPVNVDIAASTQRLFEETILLAAEVFYKILTKHKIWVDNLCLSGGTALNCPANQRLLNESKFRNVFIEPSCDDSGLALGAALFCQHNLLDQPLSTDSQNQIANPYLGLKASSNNTIENTLEEFKGQVTFQKLDDFSQDAAQELANDKIIGWFNGRSEIGPRALGHRSILADPRRMHNLSRVNQIKRREFWRPFAPAVLESEVENWFLGMPIPSPYMLFTALSKSNQVPAVTHVDGSARLQTVSDTNEPFFTLIREFFKLTGIPIVLNTSFNGPGEPIIETPSDALNFFIKSQLDILYINSFKVIHKQPSGINLMGNIIPEKRSVSDFKGRNAEAFMHDFIARKNSDVYRYPEPQLLLEGFEGYNIIGWQQSYYALPQSLGSIDLSTMTMAELEELDDIRMEDSLRDLKEQLLEFPLLSRSSIFDQAIEPKLLLEGIGGYNIVKWKQSYYAIPQALGSIDFKTITITELQELSGMIIGDSLAYVKSQLLESEQQRTQSMLRETYKTIVVKGDSKFWRLRNICIQFKLMLIRLMIFLEDYT